MFHAIFYRALSNEAFYHLGKDILGVMDEYDTRSLQLVDLQKRLKKAITDMEEAIHNSGDDSLPEKIAQQDEQQDECFIALRNYIESCSHRNNRQWQEASSRLMMIFRAYGWPMYAGVYTNNLSRLENLIIDLEKNGEFAKDLEVLDATSWFEELKKAYHSYAGMERDFKQKNGEYAECKPVAARKKIKMVLNDLFDYITVTYRVSRNETYDQLAADINERIDHHMLEA